MFRTKVSSAFRTKLLFPCIVAVKSIKTHSLYFELFRASHEREVGPVRAPLLSCHASPPYRELRDKTVERPALANKKLVALQFSGIILHNNRALIIQDISETEPRNVPCFQTAQPLYQLFYFVFCLQRFTKFINLLKHSTQSIQFTLQSTFPIKSD